MNDRFPRYLGVDDDGDRVWELANGRWTWGDTRAEADARGRTFEPRRYVQKYGIPTISDEERWAP